MTRLTFSRTFVLEILRYLYTDDENQLSKNTASILTAIASQIDLKSRTASRLSKICNSLMSGRFDQLQPPSVNEDLNEARVKVRTT